MSCLASCNVDVSSLLFRCMLLQYRDVLTSQCNDLCQYIRVALSDGVLRGAQLSHWLAILEKTESALAREPDDLPGDVSHMGIVCV